MAKVGFDTQAFASFFALVVFAGILFGGVYAVINFPQYRSEASSNKEPVSTQLVNVTENSMSIFWQTEEPTTGFLSYGPTSALGRTRTDDRDQEANEQQKYRNHLVTLRSLTPKTKYYYTIGVDSLTFDRGGFPYTFFTNASIEQKPLNAPVSTRIREAGGSLADDYFVSFTFEDQSTNQISNVIGALTQSDGTVELPVGNLRTQDGTTGFTLTAGKAYTVEATLYNNSGKSDAQTFTYVPRNAFPRLVFGSTVRDQLLLPSDTQPTAVPTPRPLSVSNNLIDRVATPTATLAPRVTPTVKPEVKRLLF